MSETSPTPGAARAESELAPAGFGIISRVNHWLVAVAFLGALLIGFSHDLFGLTREQVAPLMNWHKAFGFFVLIYGIWRVGWRIREGFPAPAGPAPHWQEMIAKGVHYALLTAIIVMPLSGVLMTIAGGRDLAVWGVTLLPSIGKIEWLQGIGHEVHEIAAPVLAGLVTLHIAGALKHHFIDRDATLRRMVTG